MLVGEVEEESEVLNAEGTEVFEVVDGETIRPNSARVAAEPNGLLDCVCGERCGVGVEGMGSVQKAFDTAGVGVGGEWDYCSKLFGEGGGYCFVV